mgnify:CR=1 FL=1
MSIPTHFAFCLGVFFLSQAGAQAQIARDLLTADATPTAVRIAVDSPVVRARNVFVDVDALRAESARVRIEPFAGEVFEFERIERTDVGSDEFTWTGKLVGDGESRAVIAVSETAVCGTLRVGKKLFRLNSSGGSTCTVEEIDERRVAPCSTTNAHHITSALPPAPSSALSSALVAPATIDVMVVWTPQARIGQGSVAAMQALVDLAVLETNQAYQNSQVTQRLRLAHRAELVNFNETGNWGVDMGRLFNPTDGFIDYVHAWRAQCGADAIVMIMDGQGGNCGVSFLMGTLDPGFAPNAFALVSRTCATGFYSFGHELGHLFGLAHDRDNASDKSMRASYSSTLTQANSASYSPVVSALGQHVAFVSEASNLVTGDSNGIADVFLRDRPNYTTTRIDISTAGTQANGVPVSPPAISQSGAFVAFASQASNLVASDTNGFADVFVRDVSLGVTTRVSVLTSGLEANGTSHEPALSLDGRYVAFTSTATNMAHSVSTPQIYVHDRQTATTQIVSRGTSGFGGNAASNGASISSDGRYVAFSSTSTDLVAADTNGKSDVFVRDTLLNTTTRVSVANGGLQANDHSPLAPTLSADGRWIVFTSLASNLVAPDANNTWDVFVHDLQTATTVRASVGPGGAEGNGPSGWMARSSITDDGRFVAFGSRASNMIAVDGNGSDDAFVRDMQQGTTVAASVTPSGNLKFAASANVDQATTVSISSANGNVVVFVSSAALEVVDTNSLQDAYIWNAVDPLPPGVEPWSFGYRTPDQQLRTIMSYTPGTRVQYFSNPNVSFAGQPLGIAVPDPYAAECWKSLNYTASTVAGFTPSVYVPFCAGDGSATACPCGNASALDSGRGCANSLGLTGFVTAQGTASLTNDKVVLKGSGMPDAGVLYFQGTAQMASGAGVVFGDGLLCVSGTIRRLGVKFNSANASTLPASGDPALSVSGALSGAATVNYQLWYRDAIAHCTGDTFNLTNGLSIVWGP